ncbi:hypothetical protein OURE66S_01675 [Oligella ureolytica]
MYVKRRVLVTKRLTGLCPIKLIYVLLMLWVVSSACLSERVVVTVDKHANTSAASVPLAFDEARRDGRIKEGQLVLLQGVGGGFTWGSVLVRV